MAFSFGANFLVDPRETASDWGVWHPLLLLEDNMTVTVSMKMDHDSRLEYQGWGQQVELSALDPDVSHLYNPPRQIIDQLFDLEPHPSVPTWIPYESGPVVTTVDSGFLWAGLSSDPDPSTHSHNFTLVYPGQTPGMDAIMGITAWGDYLKFFPDDPGLNPYASPYHVSVEITVGGPGAAPPPPPHRFSATDKLKFQEAMTAIKKQCDVHDMIVKIVNPETVVIESLTWLAQETFKEIGGGLGIGQGVTEAMLGVGDAAEALVTMANPLSWVSGTASAIGKLMILLLDRLHQDPPDGNFTEVFEAPDWNFAGHPDASAIGNALVAQFYALTQDYAETLVAAERYQGAMLAGDEAAQAAQNAKFESALALSVAHERALSDLTTAFLAEIEETIGDFDLGAESTLADAQAYLTGLADPIAEDPFLASVFASLTESGWMLPDKAAAALEAAIAAVGGLTAETLSGSALAALAESAEYLSGISQFSGARDEYSVITSVDANGALATEVVDGVSGRDGVRKLVAFEQAQFSDRAVVLPHVELVGTTIHFAGEGEDDRIIGNAGANAIDGGDGNDVLHGGTGADTLIGGGGIDTADYAGNFGAVRVNLAAGTGQWNAAHGDTLSQIENVNGTEFGDTLIGNGGVNRLEGRGGNDALHGGLGADTLVGGAGVDTADYNGNVGAVRVDLFAGTGLWNAAQGDTLGTIENVTGTSHNDVLLGDNSANVLHGGMGADSIAGRGGLDTADYTGNAGAVRVDLFAGTGLWNAAHGDTLSTIENVTGTSFNDVLLGDHNANVLNGGLGADSLTGRGGADNFLFNTALGASNVDAISDYNAADTIQIDGAVFTQAGALGTLAASRFRIGAGAADGDDRIIYNSSTGALSYDADGNGGGSAIQFATLSTGLAMTNADFVVI